jgi:hypothetical protein
MSNSNSTEQTNSIRASLSEQIIAALFDNLENQVEFDDVCITELKKLAKAGNLSNEQQVLAALQTAIKS